MANFLMLGLLFIGISLFLKGPILASIIGVLGFSCLWSIHELFEQEKRVKSKERLVP